MKVADVIRYIAALQEEGCTVERIAVNPADSVRLEAELAEDPTSVDATSNQIALRLFEGHKARFYVLGHPVLADETVFPGSISMQWCEAA